MVDVKQTTQKEICQKCGEENSVGVEVCGTCGAPFPSPSTALDDDREDSKKRSFQVMAIASFVFGLISLLIFTWVAGLFIDIWHLVVNEVLGLILTCLFFAFAISGLVLGVTYIRSKNEFFKSNPGRYRLAVAGFLLNTVAALSLLWTIILFIGIMARGFF